MVSYSPTLDGNNQKVIRLNPYCSGQWSRTNLERQVTYNLIVLILIVVDNGLVPTL